MNNYNPFRSRRLALNPMWLILYTILLLLSASIATAVEHQVFGQVLQISADDAADEAITNEDLTGIPRSFVRVKVFDADSLEQLGEVDSDRHGLFSVTFDKPVSYTPNIDIRVAQILQDPDTLVLEHETLLPAREDINMFSTVPQYFMTFVKVLAPDELEYNVAADAGLTSTPGVGLVFTRVGKVEIPYIQQDTSNEGGLADFSIAPDGLAQADEWGVPRFRDAPFASVLDIYGDFGKPGEGSICDPPGPPPPPDVDFYRIKIRKLTPSPGSWQVWKQPLHKIRTLVTTAPFSVVHQRVPMGPFDGNGGAVEGLYWVNRNEIGGITNTFYSSVDVRAKWRSHQWPEGDGLYEFNVEYYQWTGGDIDSPTVTQLDPSCFLTPSAPVGQLYLRINNQPIQLQMNGVYLKDTKGTSATADDTYYAGPGLSDVTDRTSAFDFNTSGLCDIMELENKYGIEIVFTARHPANYMRSYNLRAKPNSGTTVVFASESYPDASSTSFPPTASPPHWEGAPVETVVFKSISEFGKCGYIFELSGKSRLQNGDHYTQHPEVEKTWYVDPEVPSP